MSAPSSPDPEPVARAEYPAWLDRDRYPFDSYRVDLPEGRLHVVDEGAGRPVLAVHGNPTWSFLYRHLIRGLSDEYRVVAPDLFGFGLSERPRSFSYRPAAHARVVERVVDALDLEDAVLVGHDWGGPIAADVATRRPDAVGGLAASNTWAWPREDRHSQLLGRLAGTRLGGALVRRYNLWARVALGVPYRVRSAFDRSAYRHYVAPMASAADRVGSLTFVRELVRSRGWLERLRDRRDAVADAPVLLLWGRRDPIHGPFLSRWLDAFPNASVVGYDRVGHFVPEEVGAALVPPVRSFLDGL